MLNRRMTEIIREQQFSGRVLGIKASYTPRFDPDTGARLESLSEQRQRRRAPRHRLHPGESGGHDRQRRPRRQSAVPQHVLSRDATSPRGRRAPGPCSGLSVRTPAESSPACGSAPILRGCSRTSGSTSSLPHPDRDWRRATPTPTCYPGHPTFPFRRSTGITLGHELLRASDRREPGGQALLQRAQYREALRQPGLAGRAARRLAEAFAPACPGRLAQLQSRAGSSKCTTTIPRWTPRWR